jgi:plastocyanin
MQNPLVKFIVAGLTAVAALSGMASADVLLDSTTLVGLPAVAAPAELAFTATTAEALTVTLTDLQAPAAFSTLQIAVTLGDTLVGSANVDATTHTATVAIPAATGNYVLHVVGTPDATQMIGGFGACVTRNADPTPRTCIAADSFSGNILTPSTPSTAPSSGLNTNFTSTVAGGYTVTITDDVFPVALQQVSGGITQGSTPVNSTGFTLGANQVTLAAGTTYTLLLGALADATVQAGLYSVHITDPTGAAVFDRTLPVGTLASSTIVNNPAAQTLDLTLTDLMYPAAFANLGVAVTSGSTLLANLSTPGSNPSIAAPAGNLQVWLYTVTSGTPGVYSLSLSNAAASNALLSTTQVVNPSTATTATSYAFAVDLTAAGSYTLVVSDFQFPAALAATPVATVAQNGAVLQQTSSGGFTAAAGYIVVVVNAQPPVSGSGIFGVTVATTGMSPQLLLDQTQSVGATFTNQTVTVTTAGSYDVTLADLGFPADFSSLAVVVSQGSQVLGKIFGGGTFTFSGTGGSYLLTFVDTPSSTAATATATAAATAGYGLYSVHVASSAPTLTFTSSAASVTAGGAVTLTWTSENATACTASGSTAWSGTEAINGSASVVIPSTESLTLTCTGSGGSASLSVNVATTAATSSGHSGGGSVDAGLIAGLAGLLLARRRRRGRRVLPCNVAVM